MAEPLNFKMSKLPPNDLVVEITVDPTWRYRLRYWLAVQAIRFAALMLNSDVEFKQGEDTPEMRRG